MTIRAVNKYESFTPQVLLQALTQDFGVLLPRGVLQVISDYGYEVSPRDLLGRVEVTFDGEKRWLFFFQSERILKLFQDLIGFGGRDAEATLMMRDCILLAMHTTYQPQVNSDAPLARLFSNVNPPFVEFDGQLVEKGIKNSRLILAQALVLTSARSAALEKMMIPLSEEGQRFLAVKSFLDENRLLCGSVDERTVSLAHEETELYHPIAVEKTRLGELSIAPTNEKLDAAKPKGDAQAKA